MANQQDNNESTTLILKDVTLMWVHLSKPVEPFGEPVYDLRADVPKKRKTEISAYGKPKDVMVDGALNGMVSVNFKKKALMKDGSPSKKVRVVDQFKNPLTDAQIASIGNGSKGNILCIQKPYEIKGPNGKVTKSGITTMLIAVQVTELKEYVATGGIDFDSAMDTGSDDGFDDEDTKF